MSSSSLSSPASVSSSSSEYNSSGNYQVNNGYTMQQYKFNTPTPVYPAYQDIYSPHRDIKITHPTSTPFHDHTHAIETVSEAVTEPIKSKKRPRVIKLDLASTNIGFGVVHSKTKVATTTDELVSENNPIKCTMCNQTFVSMAKLFMHQHKYHKNGSSLQCPICYKKFNSQANALVHLRAHTQEKTYECNMCSQAFCDSSTLKKHIRTHTGEKPYECHLCDKKFTQSGNLKRHLTVHKKYDEIQKKNFLPYTDEQHKNENIMGNTTDEEKSNVHANYDSKQNVSEPYSYLEMPNNFTTGSGFYGYY